MAEQELVELLRTLPLIKESLRSGSSWTKQGTNDGLLEEVLYSAQNCLRENSDSGVIYFQKLPDGGYQIGYFRIK